MLKNSSPSARVGVAVNSKNTTRLRVFHYGEHVLIANPGDLLIVSMLGEAGASIEFSMLIPGREMGLFARDVNRASMVYEANRDWLSAPATRLA